MRIEQARTLNLETPVGRGMPVVIAAPRSVHGRAVAERIEPALRELGARVSLAADPQEDVLQAAEGPVVVVGNLADSRCVQSLYYRLLCATDLWYPGPGGYELRTLCDPFGSGQNVILLGYSDARGARAGAEALLSRLADPIPHLKDLKITRLPLAADEAEEFRREPLPEIAWRTANTTLGDSKGYLYYLTGEAELGEAYRRAWRAVIECGYDKNERIVQTHLYSLMRFLPWRLVENMGLFSAEERLAITRFLYGWAESDEGWGHVDRCPRAKRPDNPRQNHELIPALTLMIVADYFEMHFPGIPGPEKWRTAARRVYEPYGPSWKPLCDGLCHGWWMSQPVMLEFALYDRAHRYFEEDGARKAAECAMAVVNNDGWLPTAGDGDLRRQFPGPSLRVAASYYGDGRFRFVHDLASVNRRLAWLTTLPRAFDTGVESRAPEEMAGVTVVPVDPLVYHVWERDPQVAPGVVTGPPAAPIEQCFDKLSVRTGWTLADDYFLMDGLGGGSHSYDDAGGVLEYARLGVSLIVQEDSFVHSAPEHHSVVTVVRDGESGVIPGFAILEANETDGAGVVYLRVRLKDYAGADWVREVHLFPGQCAVFVDTVTANEAGDFAVEAHFRTPTRLALEGREAQGKRKSPCVGTVDVRLESLCEASHLMTVDEPIHLRYQDERNRARWKDRYRTDEVVLMSFVAREAAPLQPGESVRLVHLAQACGPGEAAVHLAESGGEIFLSDGGTQERLKSFEIRLPGGSAPGMGGLKGASGPAVVFDADDRVTALCPLDDGLVAVGTESGTVSLVDGGGRRVWRAELEGPVHDIGVVRGTEVLLAAGHGPNGLAGFDARGRDLWTARIEHEPCPWPWWELPTPAAVQVAGGLGEGVPFFAVGCGDIQVRCFDAGGTERWRWRYNEGVPGRVTVADVDGSGKDRIVVGGEILSDQSTCRILEPDGRVLAELRVEGWTSMLTALGFGAGEGCRFIACGASRGTNLHLFESGPDGGWERRWLKRVGGQVKGVRVFGDAGRVLAGTSQGFLLCYDLEGEPLWHRLFDRGIRHLAPLGDGILLVDDSGGLWTAGLSGGVRFSSSLPGPCSIAVGDGAGVCLVSGREVRRV